jgi:hypothetical protein
MVLNKLSSSHEVGHALMAELEFKASARRNKLLGYWLAEKAGLGEAEAEEYARQVVRSDLDEPGEEDVVRKVMSDIDEKGLGITQDLLRQEMERLLKVARGQIEDENS